MTKKSQSKIKATKPSKTKPQQLLIKDFPISQFKKMKQWTYLFKVTSTFKTWRIIKTVQSWPTTTISKAALPYEEFSYARVAPSRTTSWPGLETTFQKLHRKLPRADKRLR